MIKLFFNWKWIYTHHICRRMETTYVLFYYYFFQFSKVLFYYFLRFIILVISFYERMTLPRLFAIIIVNWTKWKYIIIIVAYNFMFCRGEKLVVELTTWPFFTSLSHQLGPKKTVKFSLIFKSFEFLFPRDHSRRIHSHIRLYLVQYIPIDIIHHRPLKTV